MKIYCNVCDKYKEYFETLNFFKITLAVSIVYSKCGHKKIFKEKNRLKYWNFFVWLLIWKSIRKYIIMTEENIIQEFRLKKRHETRNYFIGQINRNELMSKSNKKVCRVLNHVEHLLILVSTVTECVSISAFGFLVDIPIGIASFEIGLKSCVITASISQ